MTDYTRLSPHQIRAELDAIAADASAAFGALDTRQLNWRPDESSWSVAQCLEHLLTANREMFASMDRALDPNAPRTVWQRLPLLPGVFGRAIVKSQAPTATRKFKAPSQARPAASAIDATIVARFVDGQQDAMRRLQALDAHDLDRIIVVSPFVRFITYSALDAWRLIVTHERRHIAQARRVMATSGFPG